MFAKSFKLVFGVGAAIVATIALAVAGVGVFWLAWYWSTNPVEEVRKDARRLADYVTKMNTAKANFCANVPVKENRFIEYMDDEPVDAAKTMTQQQLQSRRIYALDAARNRNFAAIARDYCKPDK